MEKGIRLIAQSGQKHKLLIYLGSVLGTVSNSNS
jgi:hypothetical protein